MRRLLLIKGIGTDALLPLLAYGARLGEPYATRLRQFYEHCREGDLAMCVAQTDVNGDRALSPSEQPNQDSYLRIVERRRDGLVVRGAKAHMPVAVNVNEMIVLPTRAMGEAHGDYAVAFAVPLDTPGLRLGGEHQRQRMRCHLLDRVIRDRDHLDRVSARSRKPREAVMVP